jgi:hypothetical protein
MSYGQSSAFGWPLWGALLLTIPIAFVVGALTGHTPSHSASFAALRWCRHEPCSTELIVLDCLGLHSASFCTSHPSR